jgi:hypothetical protein
MHFVAIKLVTMDEIQTIGRICSTTRKVDKINNTVWTHGKQCIKKVNGFKQLVLCDVKIII